MTESEFIAWLDGTLRWAFVDGQYHVEPPAASIASEVPDAQPGERDAKPVA